MRMTKDIAKVPGWRSAQTRARRAKAIAMMRAAEGAWVDLPKLNAADLLALRREVVFEIEMVGDGSGRYALRGRVNAERSECYRKLHSRLMAEIRRDGGFGLNREGVEAAQRALTEFLEPRRVG
jgi:hypothetical protein